MRTFLCAGWQWLVLITVFVVLGMPGRAQAPQREVTLDSVTLNSTYLDVLDTFKRMPDCIGPAADSVDDMSYLNTQQGTLTMAVPGAPMLGVIPGMPSMIPGSRMPANNASTPAAKPQEHYTIWCYIHGNINKTGREIAIWETYVFFNQRGLVVGVMVAAPTPTNLINVQTETGVKIGTPMIDVVKLYDWPDPFTTVGPYYYCTYPAQNVTFGLDQQTHRVVCIAIGLSYVAVPPTESDNKGGSKNVSVSGRRR